jgi:CHRD domain
MIRRTVSIAFIAPALASGILLFSAGTASAHEVNLSAELSGSNEVPAGDAGMTGKAVVTVNDEARQVCATITSNVTGAVAMHIHKGAAGANGPVVVPLDPKTINGAKTCVTTTSVLAKAIADSPAGYYVNIHTPGAPGGAVRGNLVAGASSGSDDGTPSGSSAGSGGQAGTSGPNLALVALMVAGGGLAGAAGWRLVRR